MWSRGPRLQLRVELAPDEPGMIHELDDFYQLPIRRQAAELHPVLDEHVAIRIRDLISMTMALTDLGLSVNLCGARATRESAGVRAEAHRAAHVGHVLLRFHQRDNRIV